MASGGDYDAIHTCHATQGLVGRVIGKGGETINELQRRSGARIQIEQRVAEGEPCVVEVQGDDRAVEEARRLVHEVMGGKRLDPPYVAYAYAAMAQQGYGFPPQPNVGLASYGQVRRAHAGSFSSASDTPPGSPIPGYAVPHYPYPYYPPYGFPPAQYGPPPPGSPLPGSPARGWTQHVDANTGRPYWHHPQLGASWSPPPAGPPSRPSPGSPAPPNKWRRRRRRRAARARARAEPRRGRTRPGQARVVALTATTLDGVNRFLASWVSNYGVPFMSRGQLTQRSRRAVANRPCRRTRRRRSVVGDGVLGRSCRARDRCA